MVVQCLGWFSYLCGKLCKHVNLCNWWWQVNVFTVCLDIIYDNKCVDFCLIYIYICGIYIFSRIETRLKKHGKLSKFLFLHSVRVHKLYFRLRAGPLFPYFIERKAKKNARGKNLALFRLPVTPATINCKVVDTLPKNCIFIIPTTPPQTTLIRGRLGECLDSFCKSL